MAEEASAGLARPLLAEGAASSASSPARPPPLPPSHIGSAPGRLEAAQKKPEKRRQVMWVSALTAAAEQAIFPYDPRCMHCRTMLKPAEARWGSGLCDTCYEACSKECTACGTTLGSAEAESEQRMA